MQSRVNSATGGISLLMAINNMKISFDLDDTLIFTDIDSRYDIPVQRFRGTFYKEKLRSGTKELCKQLTDMGYKICVYTTSERRVGYIKRLFKLYGIKLALIINQQVHQAIVQGNKKEIMPSKVPSRFGIDLHIDDDISVQQNGVQYGFRVLIVNKKDKGWANKVLQEAEKVKKFKEMNTIGKQDSSHHVSEQE